MGRLENGNRSDVWRIVPFKFRHLPGVVPTRNGVSTSLFRRKSVLRYAHTGRPYGGIMTELKSLFILTLSRHIDVIFPGCMSEQGRMDDVFRPALTVLRNADGTVKCIGDGSKMYQRTVHLRRLDDGPLGSGRFEICFRTSFSAMNEINGL